MQSSTFLNWCLETFRGLKSATYTCTEEEEEGFKAAEKQNKKQSIAAPTHTAVKEEDNGNWAHSYHKIIKYLSQEKTEFKRTPDQARICRLTLLRALYIFLVLSGPTEYSLENLHQGPMVGHYHSSKALHRLCNIFKTPQFRSVGIFSIENYDNFLTRYKEANVERQGASNQHPQCLAVHRVHR